MRIVNKHKLPKVIFEVILHVNSEYDNEGSNLSASSITISPRQYWLTKRHWNEIEVDVIDLFRSFIGTSAHAACEAAAKKNNDIISEVRFSKNYLGWKVSAKIDRYNKKSKKLKDMKFSSIYSLEDTPKEEYVAQMNTQSLLMQESGYEVGDLELVVSAVDWYASRSVQDNYPKVPSTLVKVPKWPINETDNFILERVKLLQENENVPDDELPMCTKKERWCSEDKWAVLKNSSSKRATKIHDNELEARIHASKISGTVEFRPGVDKKCLRYCNCKNFCSYWKTKYGEQE